MIRSPYDGESRKLLRFALAIVAALDTAVLAWLVAHTAPSSLSHPFAPSLLLGLGGHPALVAPIAIAGLAALAHFAWRPRALGSAVIALVALAILCETHGSLIEGPMRIFFTAGAMLAGWAFGLFFARQLEPEANRAGAEERAERLAELGAVAALAATYVGAATSKLLASGLSWADANTLRALVYSQRRLEGHSPFDFYARAIGEHPWLPYTLALITLLIQLSTLLYPLGPRWRALIGSLLLVFHLNVWLLTPILFAQAMALVFVFSYPWPRWIRRLRKLPQAEKAYPEPSVELERLRPALLSAAVPLIVLVAFLGWPGVRRYASAQHEHHLQRRADRAPDVPAGEDVVALLDGLSPGDSVGELEVRAITGPAERAISIEVGRGELSFRIRVMPRGVSPMRAPVSSERFDLFYENVRPSDAALSPDVRDAALGAVQARLAKTERRLPRPSGM